MVLLTVRQKAIGCEKELDDDRHHSCGLMTIVI